MVQSSDDLRIVLADDHHFFREGLRGMLELAGAQVVGEAADAATAVALARELAPDIIVLDLRLPDMSGAEAARLIAAASPAIRIVILTVSASSSDAIDAFAAGASSYLLKDAPVNELVAAIQQAGDHTVLSREVANVLFAQLQTTAKPTEEKLAALSDRERQVLRLLAEGADNGLIAHALFISPHTVKHHIGNIFDKLGVRTRVQAAVEAARMRLL